MSRAFRGHCCFRFRSLVVVLLLGSIIGLGCGVEERKGNGLVGGKAEEDQQTEDVAIWLRWDRVRMTTEAAAALGLLVDSGQGGYEPTPDAFLVATMDAGYGEQIPWSAPKPLERLDDWWVFDPILEGDGDGDENRLALERTVTVDTIDQGDAPRTREQLDQVAMEGADLDRFFLKLRTQAGRGARNDFSFTIEGVQPMVGSWIDLWSDGATMKGIQSQPQSVFGKAKLYRPDKRIPLTVSSPSTLLPKGVSLRLYFGPRADKRPWGFF